MYKDAMLDIETLGQNPYSPVLSFAAVQFSLEEDVPTEDLPFITRRLHPAQQKNRVYDYATVMWWINQDAQARLAISSEKEQDTYKCLTHLQSFLSDVEFLWANSPSFDCIILSTLFDSFDLEFPVPWYRWRDYRTVKALAPTQVYTGFPRGTEHDALEDSRHQINVLNACMEWIRGPETRS